MNAAAREIHQSNFFSGQLTDMRLSKQLSLQIVLLIAVLISALLVVYVTNLHRVTFSQLQLEEQQSHQLELQWGQSCNACAGRKIGCGKTTHGVAS